jgi:hypothetical protein
MSTPLNEIVNVNISRDSVNISRVGFGTILILGKNATFGGRIQYFSDVSSVAAVLNGGTTDPEYKAAQAIFSQNPKVTRIAIGHRAASIVITDSAGTFTGGTIKATVNGILVSTPWASNKDDTLTAFANAIAAVSGVDTAVYSSGSHTITVTPETGKAAGLTVDISLIIGTMTIASIVYTATEDADVALGLIQEENNDWYGVICSTRDETDVMKIATWVESADKKIFCTASSDPDIIDKTLSADTDSVAKLAFAQSLLKTCVIYHSKASTEFADAALLGRIFPYDPGSYTASFKTLAGVTADNLTSTQRGNVFDKKANSYEYVGGLNMLRQGTVSGNEWLDVMIFIDWLQARCTESIFALLVGQLKVPYTDNGINSVYNALSSPLKTGQNQGGISPLAFDDQKKQIGGYYITVPRLQDVPSLDKTARTLNEVKFVAFLAGAIQKVVVSGTVTL